jgi:hypothetical protein
LLVEGFLLLRIALFAAAVPLLARIPVRRLASVLEPADPKFEVDALQTERIIRLTGLVCRYGRPLIARLCLTRGFTLYFFLRRAGVDASLVFGLGKVNDAFSGHCWLVRDGKPYLETTDPRPIFAAIHSIGRGKIRIDSANR